ncbi:hypothetical protein [Phenylobacterium sp.]|uniref:hypothetical protein n=1 Tax=Phenylobacterium sp. TaxID=1871053 RepID=UPI0011FB76A2|nr:hypothetical protein [Phenylobacterium sp.]THD64152.1 MAG: hypothetical protein E8A49_03195 [Phenylobacterium sp.]
MLTARRRRQTTWAVAASIAAHVAVAVVLLLERPSLPPPTDFPGPPEAIIPILIMPRTPPPAAGRLAQQQPIRLHRRPQPFLPPDIPTLPVAPTPAPAPAPGPATPKAVPAVHPAPQPEGPKGDVRTALRGSYVGCANADAVGLNKAERDACAEKFGKGAKDAEFAGLGLTADKQRLLDAAGAKKEADLRYKQAPMTFGSAPGAANPGASAEQACMDLGISADACGAHVKR